MALSNKIILSTGIRMPLSYLGQQGVPLSLVFTSSVVFQNEIDTEILDLYKMDVSYDELRTLVEKNKPVIWGITGNAVDRFEMFEVAKIVKKYSPKTMVVIGGIFASQTYKEIMEDIHDIDIVVRGEGEYTLYDLYLATQNKAELKDILGISWRDNGFIRHNNNREIIYDLNILPNPPFDLIDHKLYYNSPSRYFSKKLQKQIYDNDDIKVAELMFNRGCPFNCIFCVSNKHFFKRYRTIRPERAVEHIKWYYERGYRLFVFWDDHLLMKKKWFNRLYELIKNNNLVFKFKMSSRVAAINNENAEKLRKIGCLMICLGIEYGDDDVLKHIGKDLDTAKTLEVVKILNKNKIKPYGGMIINFPAETYKTINNSISFFKTLEEYGVDNLQPHPVMVFPGTVLSKEYWEKNNRTFRWTKTYFNKYNMIYHSSPYVPIWQNWSWVKEVNYLITSCIEYGKKDAFQSILTRILYRVDEKYFTVADRFKIKFISWMILVLNFMKNPIRFYRLFKSR